MASVKRNRSLHGAAAISFERKRTRLAAEEVRRQLSIDEDKEQQHHQQIQSTMDSNETRTLHPRELLRQVANSMNWRHNELSLTLPVHTTWRAAIQAAEAALGDVDEPMFIMPRRAANRRRLREAALETAQSWNSSLTSPTESTFGLPIRTSVDLQALGSPAPPSEETRKRLREVAKRAATEEFREPYVRLRADLVEGYLPTIMANLTLRGLDGPGTNDLELNSVEMIWDTGAHRTIIAEDLLPADFRQYLTDPIHDPYRSSDGLCLQIDADIAFTNCPVSINAVALVVPKEKMPNERVGVLFGQGMCIDRLTYDSIPRQILEAKGENIPQKVWGDIIVKEYLDEDDKLVSL